LISNKLACVGIECFEQEPTPNPHPLFEFDHVVLIPFMAAHTEKFMVKMAVHPVQKIVRLETKN